MSTHNEERDSEIMRLVGIGYSNRRIAIMAKCSHQNIDQIRRRIARQSMVPLTTKLTDEDRRSLKRVAHMLLREALGVPDEDEPSAGGTEAV